MVEIGPLAQEEHWGASCAPSTMCHAALLPLPKMNVNGERKKCNRCIHCDVREFIEYLETVDRWDMPS